MIDWGQIEKKSYISEFLDCFYLLLFNKFLKGRDGFHGERKKTLKTMDIRGYIGHFDC